jgi:hypothetical protein
MEKVSASEVVHVSVEEPPATILVGYAESVQIGFGLTATGAAQPFAAVPFSTNR